MKKLLLFLLAAAGLSLVAYVLVQRSPGRPQPLRGTPDRWPEVPRKLPGTASEASAASAASKPAAKKAPARKKAPAPRAAADARAGDVPGQPAPR